MKPINIDPEKFANQIPRDVVTGDQYFDEDDVLKFLVDEINVAGMDIAMIYKDHELGIEYRGKLEYFSMNISSLETPGFAARDGIVELANRLNDRKDLTSWVEYQHGLYYLHIDEKIEVSK